MKRLVLPALLCCASCSVWTDRATLELHVLGTAAEREQARQRIAHGIPGIAPADLESLPEEDGGTLLVRGAAALTELRRGWREVRAFLFAPPAGAGWHLTVRMRTSTETGARWEEWATAANEPDLPPWASTHEFSGQE